MNQSKPAGEKKGTSILRALIRGLYITGLFGAIGTFFTYLPDFQSPSMLGLFTTWGLSIAMGVAGFLEARNPHWGSQFVLLFSLSTLFLASAIHALGPYFSGWLWIASMVGVYLIAWILPLVNMPLARAISEEQMKPKTWLGRNLPIIMLLVAILLALTVGVFTFGRTHRIHPAMLFIGTMSAILAIGLGQTFAHQVRKRWEKQVRPGNSAG